MNMEDLLRRYIELKASGRDLEAEELRPAVERYFELVGQGVSPKKARAIMNLYLD